MLGGNAVAIAGKKRTCLGLSCVRGIRKVADAVSVKARHSRKDWHGWFASQRMVVGSGVKESGARTWERLLTASVSRFIVPFTSASRDLSPTAYLFATTALEGTIPAVVTPIIYGWGLVLITKEMLPKKGSFRIVSNTGVPS